MTGRGIDVTKSNAICTHQRYLRMVLTISISMVLLLSGPLQAKQKNRFSLPIGFREAGAHYQWTVLIPTAPIGLRMNDHFIAGPQMGESRQAWLAKLLQYRKLVRDGDAAIRKQTRQTGPLDLTIYDREDLKWVSKTFNCHFTFMYDRSFYDPDSGEYILDRFIDDGIREFGGYDAILLWQAYPRLGVDQRNQFDMYRDMPGGLDAIRKLIRRAHQRDIRVFVDYNPWDQGTRREDKSDEESLAELVETIEADGIFLDTMSASSTSLRAAVDKLRAGVAFVPEGHPKIGQLSLLSASWAQWLKDVYTPGMLHLKWIEPRHMQYQIKRWDQSHQDEIESAFFNGSGMMIWENIFGSYNPWLIEDRLTWRRAAMILHNFAENFVSDEWDPFCATLIEKLYAHRWPGKNGTIFTLLNYGEPIRDAALLEVRAQPNFVYYDLWSGRSAQTKKDGKVVQIKGSIDRLGCLMAIEKEMVDKALLTMLKRQKEQTTPLKSLVDHRNFDKSLVYPEPVARTKLASSENPPAGMVFVPKTTCYMQIEHKARECGCYPDPGMPAERWGEFLSGNRWTRKIEHNIGPIEVHPFFIDETEVTNAQFKRFLDESGYKPKHTESFLKHWPNGKMPEELANHPVVYVDIDDARAYTRWAGKRLPTEYEWQLAAQGTDGRVWPWGNEFDPDKCNTTGDRTLPVRSCAKGRSPCGCYHMSGNVWEWTESCRDDGHTRFVMIRGGSYFNAEGSHWYVEGGPRPCNHHVKFIRMWPGLDRCATIGFRCVVDAREEI